MIYTWKYIKIYIYIWYQHIKINKILKNINLKRLKKNQRFRKVESNHTPKRSFNPFVYVIFLFIEIIFFHVFIAFKYVWYYGSLCGCNLKKWVFKSAVIFVFCFVLKMSLTWKMLNQYFSVFLNGFNVLIEEIKKS